MKKKKYKINPINQQIAIDRLNSIVNSYDKPPRSSSNIPQERKDYHWIRDKKRKRKRKMNWYPILDKIAKQKGWPTLFQPKRKKIHKKKKTKTKIIKKKLYLKPIVPGWIWNEEKKAYIKKVI
jgi:hypothetical protein